MKHQSTRSFLLLTGLCTLAYFISYISRINLSASVIELVRTGFAGKDLAALALSVNALTYGAGQIISGYLGDKYKPQHVMCAGFLLASAMNLTVAMLPTARLLIPVWAVNGFAQALMWPPMVRILAHHLTDEQYAVACKWVSWGSALGTMAVYACVPALIRAFDFRAIFWIGGTAALLMAVVMKTVYERYFGSASAPAPAKQQSAAAPARPFDAVGVLLLAMIMVAIVMQGALRDGVTNWMPTLVSESFGLDSSSAIFSGILLPIFHILFSQITATVYRRFIPNELTCSCVIFTVAAGIAAALALVGSRSVIISVVLLAMLVGCMHGVNFIFTCMVPPRFAKYGHVSLVSGILNSSTYAGAALSTYGVALLSQHAGWHATLWCWAGLAAIGAVITLLLIARWRLFRQCP